VFISFHYTNINKTNIHFLPQIIEHKKCTMICDVGNPGPGLAQDVFNQAMGSPPAIHNKQAKQNLHIFVSTQKDHILSQNE
jgi:hypothetical protein